MKHTIDLKNKALELRAEGKDTKEIANMLNISRRSVQRYLKRSKTKVQPIPKPLVAVEPMARVLVIGDLHCPFDNPKYLDFLKEIYERYHCTRVVCIGDMVDMSTLSRHQPEAEALGVPDEFTKAKEHLKKYMEAFPHMSICWGNHTQRLLQRANDAGIPEFCLKSLRELFELPETWEIADTWEINGVTYLHGTQFNSRNILTTAANYTSGSIAFGHQHSLLGCVYNRNLFNKEAFAMCVGCGIDETAYAFKYGKNAKMKPILGCGVVISSTEAYAIKMEQ